MSKRAANMYTAEALVKVLGLPTDAIVTGAKFNVGMNTVTIYFASEWAPDTPENCPTEITTMIDSWSLTDE